MGKHSDLPSRSEVKELLDKSKEDMREKETDLDKIACDVETVRKTLESLNFEGTAEGSEEIEGAIKGAEEVTETVFNGEDEKLDRIQQENEEHETGLETRSDSSEQDLRKIVDASAGIETRETVSELARTKELALQDIGFLKEQIERALRSREESEQAQKELQSRVRRRGA